MGSTKGENYLGPMTAHDAEAQHTFIDQRSILGTPEALATMSHGGCKSSATGDGGPEAPRAASQILAAASETVANSEPDAGAEQQQQQQEPKTAGQKLRAFYARNFGLFLIFLAEIFASLVSPVAVLRAFVHARAASGPSIASSCDTAD